MTKPKPQNQNLRQARVEICVMCDGRGWISEDIDMSCDWCDGTGRVTKDQLEEYLTAPAFEDWKSSKDIKIENKYLEKYD